MERKVAIVTDTLSCIPPEELKNLNIREVPIKVLFEDRVYQDRVDLKANEFYAMLAKARRLPTTAAPSPEQFLDTFSEMSQYATSILCITVSSKLSGTYNSARIAADMAREALPRVAVEVLDSRVAAAAEGFVVLAAARAAAEGRNLAEVISTAEKVMSNVHLFAMVDTLKYLVKGGRAPKVAGWAGALLNIKPLLALKDGEAHPAGRARSYLSAIEQMIEMSKHLVLQDQPLHMAVMHAAEPEKAEEFKKLISTSFDCAELMVTEFTPVMGVHTGPGLIGMAFYNGD